MAKVNQVLIDKLFPLAAQEHNGKMYVTPMDEHYLCNVLDGAELGEGRPGLCQQGAGHVVFDGSVPYKLCTAYKDSPAVEKAIAEMTWVRSVYWYSVPTVPVFRKCDAIRYSKMFCY